MRHLQKVFDPVALLGCFAYILLFVLIIFVNACIQLIFGFNRPHLSFPTSWVLLAIFIILSIAIIIFTKKWTWILVFLVGCAIAMPSAEVLNRDRNNWAIAICICFHIILISMIRSIEEVFSRMNFIENGSIWIYGLLGMGTISIELQHLSDALPVHFPFNLLYIASIICAAFSIVTLPRIATQIGQEFKYNNYVTEMQNAPAPVREKFLAATVEAPRRR
jgi:hypothetical protein